MESGKGGREAAFFRSSHPPLPHLPHVGKNGKQNVRNGGLRLPSHPPPPHLPLFLVIREGGGGKDNPSEFLFSVSEGVDGMATDGGEMRSNVPLFQPPDRPPRQRGFVQQVFEPAGNLIRRNLGRNRQIVQNQPPSLVDQAHGPTVILPVDVDQESAVHVEFHVCVPSRAFGDPPTVRWTAPEWERRRAAGRLNPPPRPSGADGIRRG
jgi:hypothetical protein